MKNLLLPILGIVAGAVVCSAAPSWETDWPKAVQIAKTEQRPMLIDFTGSDWCPGCIYLRKNIFDTELFLKYAGEKNYVLMELDFPKTKGAMPEKQLNMHLDIMRHLDVKTFPTVVLVDSKGVPYAKLVSATKTPEEYLQRLQEAEAVYAKFREELAAAQSLQNEAKMEQLVKALKTLPADVQGYHKELIAEIASLDPQDKYGFTAKAKQAELLAKQRLLLDNFHDEIRGIVKPDEQPALREKAFKLLEDETLLPIIRLDLLHTISGSYSLERDYYKSLEYLEKARDAAPDSPEAKRLQPWIDNMRAHLPEKKD